MQYFMRVILYMPTYMHVLVDTVLPRLRHVSTHELAKDIVCARICMVSLQSVLSKTGKYHVSHRRQPCIVFSEIFLPLT